MVLRIERGKGRRFRNAMLPEGLLPLLRDWWRAGRQQGVMLPDDWLFPGQNATVPISTRRCIAWWPKRLKQRISSSKSVRTPCGTASPRTYLKMVSISASCRRCSVTPSSTPLPSIRRSPPERCARSSVRSTGWRPSPHPSE